MLKLFNRQLKPGRAPTIYRSLSTATSAESQFENSPAPEHVERVESTFAKEFRSNRIELTAAQRFILSAGSSIAALLDPRRQDMIACLGETTGDRALSKMLRFMKSNAEGQQILADEPRINSKTVDLDSLSQKEENTFGYQYYKFLKDNNVTPDSRLDVRFMDDAELAYVMTRYRETHDLAHTVLGMPTNMLGEVAVKWVEAINTELPMCYGGAVFGAIRLRPKQRKLYSRHILPWALAVGRQMKPLISVYWEQRWDQDIEDLRKELNITTINVFK